MQLAALVGDSGFATPGSMTSECGVLGKLGDILSTFSLIRELGYMDSLDEVL